MITYFAIYKTTNLINNKIYIGAHTTRNLDDRYLGSGTALNKAFKKYGKQNFKKEILMLFDTKQEMYENEAILVTKEFINKQNNYNEKVGGFGGFCQCQNCQTKRRIARVNVPAWNKGLRAVQEYTEERNLKVSIGNKNKPKTKSHVAKVADSQPHRKEILLVDKNIFFSSLKELARNLEIDTGNIKQAIKTNRKAHGFLWRYLDRAQSKHGLEQYDPHKHAIIITSNKRRVLCVETGIIYESASEAARRTGCLVDEAARRNGKSKGFHWKYL